ATLVLNLAVGLDDPEHGRRYAFLRLPDVLPRLVRVPTTDETSGETYVWLEQLVAAHIDTLFKGVGVAAVQPFRIVRSADLETETPQAGDLLELIEAGVSHRRFNTVSALQIPRSFDAELRAQIILRLDLHPDDVWETDGPLALGDLM